MKGIWGAVITVVLASCAVAPAHAISIVLPRAGQVGIGMQGGYGGFVKGGTLGDEFGLGGMLDVQLRYRMRYERGVGLTFEAQRLKARGRTYEETSFLAITDSVARKQLSLNLAGLDLYQYFGTRTRMPVFLQAGAGIAQLSAKLENGDVQYPINGDGFYLSAGAGLERFVYRSWAVDASARYSAIFMDGKVNHDLRVGLGVILYAAY